MLEWCVTSIHLHSIAICHVCVYLSNQWSVSHWSHPHIAHMVIIKWRQWDFDKKKRSYCDVKYHCSVECVCPVCSINNRGAVVLVMYMYSTNVMIDRFWDNFVSLGDWIAHPSSVLRWNLPSICHRNYFQTSNCHVSGII